MNSHNGLAIVFDLGTTTIAATLVDTESGERLASKGAVNPQREFGLDVVSRLDAALGSDDILLRMKKVVNDALQLLARDLLDDCNLSSARLRLVAVAGNPAMEHILLGLPLKTLAFPPYRPLFTSCRLLKGTELGWELNVETCLFPLPGGFVGGDLVAFLYGCGVRSSMIDTHDSRLYLDLGTNGEIALVHGGRIYATSAAAGPAFEGGNLSCGMAALDGAVSGVRIDGEKVSLTTIGGGPPVGICGSGVIEAVSQLLLAGIIDRTGRLLHPQEIPSNLANRVKEMDGETAFVLYRDAERELILTQKDIRQVQLAKAAIRAGIDVLIRRAGAGRDEVEGVALTGSFGAVLDPDSLKNIGILHEKMVKKCAFLREGALAGAEKAVIATGGMEDIEELAKNIRVIPLSGTPLFEKYFLEQMNFPIHKP